MKKIVSAISALTTAVSAFASMAVVASADSVVQASHSTSGAITWDIQGGSNASLIWPTISSGTETINSHNHDGKSGDRGSVYYYDNTLTPTTQQTVTVDFTVGLASANQNATHIYLMGSNVAKSNNVPSSNVILDIALGSYAGTITANGTDISKSVPVSKDTSKAPHGKNYGNTALTPMSASLDFLNYTVDLTISTYDSESQTTSTVTYSDLPMVDATVTGFRGFYSLTGRALGVTAVKDVTTYLVDREETVLTAGYTVKYVDESGNEIKTAVTDREGQVGDSVSAAEADLADIVYNNQNYIYRSGNEEITLENDAAKNVITLVFGLPNTYKANVTAAYGENSTEKLVDNIDIVEHENLTYNYPKYKMVDGVLYNVARGAMQSSTYYGKIVSSVTGEINDTVPYTALTDNAVFYGEGEDVLTERNVANNTVRCSNGKGGDVSEKTEIVTLPAGVYKIESAVWGGGKNEANQSTYRITVGEVASLELKTTGSLVQQTTEEFTITEDTVVAVEKTITGTSAACVDYILITKTGDYTPATATYEQVGEDYATETGDESVDAASVFKLTITAGTDAITSVGVKVNGVEANEGTIALDQTVITGGSTVFAVVVNAAASEVKSMTAVINGANVTATID